MHRKEKSHSNRKKDIIISILRANKKEKWKKETDLKKGEKELKGMKKPLKLGDREIEEGR